MNKTELIASVAEAAGISKKDAAAAVDATFASISKAMAEPLQICYDAVPEPKVLLLCGSEACSGGLFADSKAVKRDFLERYKVDLWLPGTPTHPMTFLDGVMNMLKLKSR